MDRKELEQPKEDVPVIELYKVESIMVHASRIVKNMVICLICGFLAIVAIVWIFTSKYNERNQNWLSIYNRLLESRITVAAEVQDENTENIQQLPSP